MIVSQLVSDEVRGRFSRADADDILQRMQQTSLPFLDAPDRDRERDRVHLAIIKLAAGMKPALYDALALAAVDWRDVLVAAGMAHDDWPAVLSGAGFPVP